MKQGSASSNTSAPKAEPKPKAVNPGAVSQLGCMVGSKTAVQELYRGKGYKAPMHSQTTHKAGSQGRH
jgi:hypothetical protein